MLVLIETTDVIFAVDSIPAILAVSREQFIVFTSNAFAILGLRALYFLLADAHSRFHYLQLGLAVILVFVGIKMILSNWYHIPTPLSLGFIALVLVVVDRRFGTPRRRRRRRCRGGRCPNPSTCPPTTPDAADHA